MRVVILVTTFIIISTTAFPQKKKSLALDERGKYTYYEVVEVPAISKDSLFIRSKLFFKNFEKRNIKLVKSLSNDTLLSAVGKFIIGKGTSILSHPSGEVIFNLIVELKEGKYRYWLTDFKFVPYQRDRYGNLLPASSIYVALENKPSKLNAETWKDNISATTDQAYNLGESLKTYLAGIYKAVLEVKPKTISKEKW